MPSRSITFFKRFKPRSTDSPFFKRIIIMLFTSQFHAPAKLLHPAAQAKQAHRITKLTPTVNQQPPKTHTFSPEGLNTP